MGSTSNRSYPTTLAGDTTEAFLTFRTKVLDNVATSFVYKVDEDMQNTIDSVDNLAGSGRTTETVKGNADAITALQTDKIYKFTVAGTNNYTVSGITGITSYYDGLNIRFTATSANTGSSTINVNSLGVKSLTKIDSNGNAVDIEVGDVRQNSYMDFQYNGTSFVMIQVLDADRINVIDIGGYYTSTKVEDVLQEVGLRLLTPKKIGGGLIINGNFDIWQRGVSFNAVGYTADRWETPIFAAFVERVNNTSPTKSKYMLRLTGDGGTKYLNQKIENPNNVLYNLESVLSFWVKSSANIPLTARLRNETAGVTIQDIIYSATTSWQKIEIKFDASTNWNNDDVINVRLINGFTGTEVIEFAQVKFEAGDKTTEFIPKTYAEELRDCQRYYFQKGLNNFAALGRGEAASTTSLTAYIETPDMRLLNPTLVQSGSFELRDPALGSIAITGLVAGATNLNSENTKTVVATTAGGLTANRTYTLRNANDATAYIAFDAEL